jgi:hypothetical protein
LQDRGPSTHEYVKANCFRSPRQKPCKGGADHTFLLRHPAA